MEEELQSQEVKEEIAEKDRRILELENENKRLKAKVNNLKRKAHSYKEVIHSSPSLIVLLQGEDLIIEVANKPALKFWQKDKSIIGKPVKEAHPDFGEQGLEQLLLNVLRTGKPEYGYEMPIYISRNDRKELSYFNFVYQPQRDIENKITGVAVIAQEVTPKAIFHQKLKESEYKYRELIHSSNSLIAILRGEDMVIEIANKAIKNVWGKGDDVEGKPLFEVLPEMIGQGMPKLFKDVYETGESYVAQERPLMHTHNGEMKLGYYDFIYQPHRNVHGEIDGVAVIAHDVTNQGHLNKKIKESEKEFRELVNFMPHKISVSDAEGNPIFYNNSWVSYTGKTIDKLLENSWHFLIYDEDRARADKLVSERLESGEDFELELRMFDREMKPKWHLARATAVKNEEGKVTSWIASCTEIQKLKEDEKRKEDFLKLVSHELKTPITTIKGYVQLLLAMIPEETAEKDKILPVKPYLNRIETQVERLIRLLYEMLDLSRIEQNELELKREKFNINQHIEEIVEDLNYSNKDADIRIFNDYDCDVMADKDRIGQVLINFVTNALKYSPNSQKVDICIYDNGNEQVAVSVKDYGIGIDKKEQRQIFKRFYRIAGEKGDTYPGFGIGLYLSNEIIERHNGEIHVNSTVGKGSEFIFTIPLNLN
ncbi:MAG: PAS domain-containing protein [Gramella sp.]|nr:PAS domain-containing protein [Christiangramia sp.]